MTTSDRAGNEEPNPTFVPPVLRTTAGTRIVDRWPYSTGDGDSWDRISVRRMVEAVETEAAALAAAPTQTGAEGPGDYWRGVRDAKAAADARVGFDTSSPPWDDEDCRYECPLTEEGHRATDADHEFFVAALRSGAEVAAAPGLSVDEIETLRMLALEAQSVGWYSASFFTSFIDEDDEQAFSDADGRFFAALTPSVVLRLTAAFMDARLTAKP